MDSESVNENIDDVVTSSRNRFNFFSFPWKSNSVERDVTHKKKQQNPDVTTPAAPYPQTQQYPSPCVKIDDNDRKSSTVQQSISQRRSTPQTHFTDYTSSVQRHENWNKNLQENIANLASALQRMNAIASSATNSLQPSQNNESFQTSKPELEDDIFYKEKNSDVTSSSAEAFRRQRDRALRKSSSLSKKTVTFNLNKTEEIEDSVFVDTVYRESVATCEKYATPIGIMKKCHSAVKSPEKMTPCDVKHNFELVSPNGTSSDSGLDSLMSSCSDCAGPLYEQGQCRSPRCTRTNASNPAENFTRLREEKEKVKHSVEYILSRLEDSINLSKVKRSSSAVNNNMMNKNKGGRKSNTAACVNDYLNVDVAQSILMENSSTDFAVFQNKGDSFALVKNLRSVSQAATVPPSVPPRKPATNVTSEKKQHRVSSPAHARPQAQDLLMMNRFHAYTLGDVMTNYSSLLGEIPEETSADDAIEDEIRDSNTYPSNSTLQSAAKESHASLRHREDIQATSKLSREDNFVSQRPVCRVSPTHQIQNLNRQDGNNNASNQKRQVRFVWQHNKRSMSDNALPLHLLHAPVTAAARKSTDQSAKSHQIHAQPRTNHTYSTSNESQQQLWQQDRWADKPYIAYATHSNTALSHRRQKHTNKSRSWACTTPQVSHNATNALAWQSAETQAEASRYVTRQLPDVRWVAGRPLQRSILSTSEPLIQWTANQMTETFC